MKRLTGVIALVLFILSSGGIVYSAEVLERPANRVAEWTFTSAKEHADPFNAIQLDAVFATPGGGAELRVPGFWAGGKTWRVRYASPQVGTHRFKTVCSDQTDAGLHGVEGAVEVKPADGDNPLYRRGPMRVSADKRYFEHADGTPFLWLADTWWWGLVKRIEFPNEFATLTKDRVAKGYNVVQLVAGLYPDMAAFDPRGENEAGFPWAGDYSRINPAYFDRADERIEYLLDNGVAPCVVGAWGYHLPWLGVERMKQHWRYVIARWGAYPVFWCAAGEGMMPWYHTGNRGNDMAFQKRGWTEVCDYIRKTDPFRRPLSIHPIDMARRQVTDASVLDFDMLQTGHSDRESIGSTITLLRQSRAAQPTMPTINSEVCYEGLLGRNDAQVQRITAWTSLLAGTAGHTYGASGIFQFNKKGSPFGESAQKVTWGNQPWDEAIDFAGSRQVGLAKKLLERFEWWRFEPHEDWAAWDASSSADSASAAAMKLGQWIWHAADGNAASDAPVAKRKFRKVVKIGGDNEKKSAIVHVSADDRFSLSVNGTEVGASDGGRESWRRPRRIDLSSTLVAGENVIEVAAENVASNVPANPAGLIVGSDVEALRSDATWTSSVDGSEWKPVKVLAKYGAAPWGTLAAQGPLLPPQAAGVPGEVRVIYVAEPTPIRVMLLERDVAWMAEHFDPVTGATKPIEMPKIDDAGARRFDPPAGADDWVLVLRRK